MLNIKMSEAKLADARKHCEEIKEKIMSKPQRDETDDNLIKLIDKRSLCKDFSDLFWEYADVMKDFSEAYSSIIPDNKKIDPTKFIFSNDPNSHYDIEMYSDYKLEHIYMFDDSDCNLPYGVCDNASQILEHYQPKDDEVIILFPVIREYEPENYGWRWHKWGPYIGVHNPRYEYIYDEEEIDVVFCFSIYKIIKNDSDKDSIFLY